VTDVAVAAAGSPYKGLARYEEADAALFFGRDSDAELVVANVLASRLTLLFGASGVGKSSLLHAGVAPRLREAGDVAAVLFSDWRGDPAASLAAAIRAAGGLEPDDGGLGTAIAAFAGATGADLVVVLDQFEEYFVYHPAGDDAFARELPRAVTDAGLPVSFLISIREDALARLERFKGSIPGLFETYLRLDRLDREAAREAIVAPLARRAASDPEDAVTAEPALVERVLDEVEVGRLAFASAGAGTLDGGRPGTGGIETPYLQLVLVRLWEEERGAGSDTLRLATLERLGGAERIVRTHLDHALAGLSADEQATAAAIFRFLVTPSGTKIALGAGDLAEFAGQPPTAIEPVLRRLAEGDARVLRPAGEDAFEIYHDVLAPAVLDWRGRYLHAQELAVLEHRRRRRWRLALVALALAILAGITGGLTIWRVQADRTDAAQRQALEQKLELARAALYTKAVYTGHHDILESVDFSPDSRRVVSADQSGDIRVWDATTASELARLHARGDVQHAVFSPDGSLVLAAVGSGKAYVWRWRDGKQVASLSEPFGFEGAVFGPGGRLAALPADDGTIRLWDWRAGRVVGVLNPGDEQRAVEFSRDGRLLAAQDEDGSVRIWDWRRQRVLAKLDAHSATGSPNAIALSPDGRFLATAGQLGAAVWDWRARRVLWVKTAIDQYGYSAVAFSRDGREVAVSESDDDAVHLWDWRRARQVAVLREGEGSVGLAVSPNGCLVATAGYDPWARVWAPPLSGCRRS
jgi:WD40 repeat protein